MRTVSTHDYQITCTFPRHRKLKYIASNCYITINKINQIFTSQCILSHYYVHTRLYMYIRIQWRLDFLHQTLCAFIICAITIYVRLMYYLELYGLYKSSASLDPFPTVLIKAAKNLGCIAYISKIT